ncbi:hypothetical protein BDK51DRAFT_25547 [Blyttiomyces helicus]|uniref:Uncharacterized protein n=1 Tax=Blyttiomyces helicus TaxID=388810 RepID=A0A4P9WSL7_9FUNG|nr:hypothetical protein BDK51DRAFT_25547 [Blyttiomyces helicus]|eukprot:RKO94300.1 hypothetical protein BDK51DRAFT_25547 [Blyttiomyces helicus]
MLSSPRQLEILFPLPLHILILLVTFSVMLHAHAHALMRERFMLQRYCPLKKPPPSLLVLAYRRLGTSHYPLCINAVGSGVIFRQQRRPHERRRWDSKGFEDREARAGLRATHCGTVGGEGGSTFEEPRGKRTPSCSKSLAPTCCAHNAMQGVRLLLQALREIEAPAVGDENQSMQTSAHVSQERAPASSSDSLELLAKHLEEA